MKKIILLLSILSLLVSCDSATETKNVAQEQQEPKIISGGDVFPIDENVMFYFFTDTNILWKFISTYESESVMIDAVIYYENAEDEEIQFSPDEFFTRDGNYFYSWMLKDYTYDEEGNLIPQIIKYYKQNNDVVEEINIYEFDDVPEIYYGTYSSPNFSLEIHEFEGYPINKLFNLYKGGSAVFTQIYEVYEVTEGELLETGLFFNVTISDNPALSEGLYFFPKERTSFNKIKEQGRLWIK